MMSQFLFLLLTCMGDLSAPRTLRIFIYLEVVLFAEVGVDGIERAASQQLVMVLQLYYLHIRLQICFLHIRIYFI